MNTNTWRLGAGSLAVATVVAATLTIGAGAASASPASCTTSLGVVACSLSPVVPSSLLSDPALANAAAGTSVNLHELDPATELLPGLPVGEVLQPTGKVQIINAAPSEAYLMSMVLQPCGR